MLEILLVLGTVTIVASIMFALACRSMDWINWGSIRSMERNFQRQKLSRQHGIVFSHCGGFLSWTNSIFAFPPAFTNYILRDCYSLFASGDRAGVDGVYMVCFLIMKTLHGFRKKDYFFVALTLLVIFSAIVAVIVIWPGFLFSLLGKDVTLTGRTGIWSAVTDSIAKRPLLGYGYQAFWLGLEGESYRVILTVSWVLAQAQNGFLDVMLEMGVAGLVIVLFVFGFAFRDGVVCLLRSRNDAQLRAVEWYLTIVDTHSYLQPGRKFSL